MSKQLFASDRLLAALPVISTFMMTGESCISDELLRELGLLLHAISSGDRADKLFRQHERRKPKIDRSGVALVYYYVWACTGNRDLAAGQAARAQSFGRRTSEEKPLERRYVLKLSQRHRDVVLDMLEKTPDEAAERARIYLCNTRQLFVLFYKNGDVSQGNLSAQEANDLREITRYELTPRKVAQLRDYLRRKSPRPH
jgi:hypothetical protein